jgi:glyoxylase-like metal-dependent hydrolase (beta-lactamase superfamily II)
MNEGSAGEVLADLWQFSGVHPEWTEHEGGEDGWEPEVAWWVLGAPGGAILIDPLVEDWDALDRLIERQGGCSGIIRTCHWHQRSIADAAARYGAEVWAQDHPSAGPFDRAVKDGEEVVGGVVGFDVERTDELALWLPTQKALIFGDAMLRTTAGALRVCPESWTQPPDGRGRLLSLLERLTELPVEHVFVSHGPLVSGDGLSELRAALQAETD